MIPFIVWDFPKVVWTIPYIDLAIYWYSLFFAIGLYGSFAIGKCLLLSRASLLGARSVQNDVLTSRYADRLFIFLFCGLLVGARIGHVLWYDLSYYVQHWAEIGNLRQGGLSSHGALLGMLVALFFFYRTAAQAPFLPCKRDLLDLLAISSGWAAFCIRFGNMMNQEIIGTPSSLPWAVAFSSPTDGLAGIPRHPVQLYEATVSLVLLIGLLYLTRGGRWARQGKIAGWYLFITFMARIVLETFKAPQCPLDQQGMHMGQILSIPVLILALYLTRGKSDDDQKPRERNALHHEKRS